MIIVAPFTQTGNVYNSEGVGIANISIQLYSKPKSDSNYNLLSSATTNSSGAYSFSTQLSANKNDFRIVIGSITVDNPTSTDAQSFTQKVLSQSFNSKDYYRMDANGNSTLSITDIFLVYSKANSNLSAWPNSTPAYRIFKASDWTPINNGTTNLTSTYPGLQVLTVDALVSGSTTNFYLVRTGFRQ
jgi:hypothetical protein